MFSLLLGPWNRTPIYLRRDAVLRNDAHVWHRIGRSWLDRSWLGLDGSLLDWSLLSSGTADDGLRRDTSTSEVEGARADFGVLLDGASVTGARSS
jgi:hypothetical protein